MLTGYAAQKQKWSLFPELGKLLSDKHLSVHWTSATSVSNTSFDEVNRILTIFALVKDNEKEVTQTVGDVGQSIYAELKKLSHDLKWTSEKFAEASKKTSDLADRLGQQSEGSTRRINSSYGNS